MNNEHNEAIELEEENSATAESDDIDRKETVNQLLDFIDEISIIQSLHIHNFKCFADQTIRFAPLTLLSGFNGQGKTSVLHSLLLLRQSYQQHLLPDTGLAVNGDWVRIGNIKDALHENATDDTISFHLNCMIKGQKIDSQWIFKYDHEDDFFKLVSEPVASKIINHPLFNDNFQYLQAERLGPRVFSEKRDFYVRQHCQLGVQGEYSADFLSTFGYKILPLHKLRHPKADSDNLIDQTSAWLGEITPHTRLKYVRHPETNLIGLRYAFGKKGTNGDQGYSAVNAGLGLSYALPVLLAILSSSKNALLLFEHPEAHLHPRGQSKLGELMAIAANCGVQIVVETHSDHIVNGIRIAIKERGVAPERIAMYYFQRSMNDHLVEIARIRVDEKGKILDWPEGFLDEWNNSLFRLI